MNQKKATVLSGRFFEYCLAIVDLVEPGGIEPPSASPLQAVLHV